MKPSELYSRKPEESSHDLEYLMGCYYNFIPEVTEAEMMYNGVLKENTRVEIRVYKDFDFDGRRFWRLCSIMFDERPVMIIQNAGREGDDHTARFITDLDAYKKMIGYIRTLLPAPAMEDVEDVVSEDDNIPDLTRFYGNELDGYFERYRH